MRDTATSYRGTTFSERMAAAACREADPDLSFPPPADGTNKRGPSKESREAHAKAVCDHCPFEIKTECLEVAMKAEGTAGAAGRHGVFGGLDPEERAALVKTGLYRPKMLGADHGTQARARAHRRAGEDPCGPCLAAETETRRHRGWSPKAVAS